MMDNEEHFLNNPEIDSYIEEKLPILINESDRGAVLLGMSQIDYELEKLLRMIAPMQMTKKEKDWIGKASLSSKLNIAYTCRLLSRNIFESINKLKKVRNDVAHNIDTFHLEDYDALFKEAFEFLGKGVNIFIHDTSIKYLLEDHIYKIMRIKHPKNKDRFIFEDHFSALKYIKDHKAIQDKIEKPIPRMKLAIGVLLISGIIIQEREKFLKVFSNDKTISSLKV